MLVSATQQEMVQHSKIFIRAWKCLKMHLENKLFPIQFPTEWLICGLHSKLFTKSCIDVAEGPKYGAPYENWTH